MNLLKKVFFLWKMLSFWKAWKKKLTFQKVFFSSDWTKKGSQRTLRIKSSQKYVCYFFFPTPLKKQKKLLRFLWCEKSISLFFFVPQCLATNSQKADNLIKKRCKLKRTFGTLQKKFRFGKLRNSRKIPFFCYQKKLYEKGFKINLELTITYSMKWKYFSKHFVIKSDQSLQWMLWVCPLRRHLVEKVYVKIFWKSTIELSEFMFILVGIGSPDRPPSKQCGRWVKKKLVGRKILSVVKLVGGGSCSPFWPNSYQDVYARWLKPGHTHNHILQNLFNFDFFFK